MDRKEAVPEGEEKPSCLQNISTSITDALENGFASLGLRIGTYPGRFILACIAVALLTGLGLLAFREESEPDKLWLPQDALVREHKDWIDANFPANVIREKMLMADSNILQAQKIKAIFDIYQESLSIETTSGLNLSDVCVKAGSNCIVYGILEIWSFDSATIQALDDSQVLSDIKTVTVSPVYQNNIDLTVYLGNIVYDGNGDVIAAGAAMMTWLTDGSDSGKDDTRSWESKFIDLGSRGHANLANVYYLAGKSGGEESSKAIQSDVVSLSIGYFLVIIFVMLVLGKFNFMEQRAWLTLAGLFCVGLSVLVSIGLSSAFQQFYGPIQSVLPFLLLGIGVDDVFVIMGALNNLSPEEQKYAVPEKISAVLRHAGVSITVTSFTDFVAFMIGATTIIPALRSFCIYAGLGVIALFVFQALVFTAFLSLDLRRQEQSRDACCWMVKRGEDYQSNKCSQTELIPLAFRKLVASFITNIPCKIIVIVVALALFGVNIYGLVELETYFDRNLFLPSDSYASKYFSAVDDYFPSRGDPGYIYCGSLSYYTHKTELESLDTLMGDSQYMINGTTDSWFAALTNWFSTTSDTTVTDLLDGSKYPTTENNFLNLTYRLTTEQETRTSSYIRFMSSTDATIKATRFPFTHIKTSSVDEEQRVLDATYGIVTSAGFSSSECFPYSQAYLTWATNNIIREELFRNMALAMACVFIVSLLLIANLVTSLLVFVCVLATLVDVMGTMHFWGLTIDTVTCVILVISVGLAVDYSAHIGHFFMTVTGSRKERVRETVGQMGPAVFYGGFSTFLAFVLLAGSNSYVFKTFFKLNFLTVFYGLFHGLIILPAMLSLLGPKPYVNASRFSHTASSGQDEAARRKNNKVPVDNVAFEQETNQEMETRGVSHDQTSNENKYEMKGQTTPTPSFSKMSNSSDSPPPSYNMSEGVQSNSGPTKIET